MLDWAVPQGLWAASQLCQQQDGSLKPATTPDFKTPARQCTQVTCSGGSEDVIDSNITWQL